MDTEKILQAIDSLAGAGAPEPRAAVDLWQATGRVRFRDDVLECADALVSPEGAVSAGDPLEILPAILLALRETGEERYRLALGGLETRLDEDLGAQPLKMELGILRDATDQYYHILGRFVDARREMEADGADLSDTVTYLAALADTLEVMNRKIYECSRPLQDSLKDALRGLLKGADPVTGLLSDAWASAVTATVIFKACRMRLILAEKYQPAGEKIVDSLLREPAAMGDRRASAALLTACVEYLKLKKWEVGPRWKS